MMPLYIKSFCQNTPQEYYVLADRITHATVFRGESIEEVESFIHNTLSPMTEREYWEHLIYDLRVNTDTLKLGARQTAWFKEREEDYKGAWKSFTERLNNEHLNPTVGRNVPRELIERIVNERNEREEREYKKQVAREKKMRGEGKAEGKEVVVMSEKKKENPVKPKLPHVKKKKDASFKPKSTDSGSLKRSNQFKPKAPIVSLGLFD